MQLLHHHIIKRTKRKCGLSTEERYIIAVTLVKYGYRKKEACKAIEVNESNYCRIEETVKVRQCYDEFKERHEFIDRQARNYFKLLPIENESLKMYIRKQFRKSRK